MTTPEVTDRVARLGEIASELETCETVDEVYDHAVSASARVLAFDAAIVCTIDDGLFDPRAVNVSRLVPGEPLPAGEGVAGKTVRESRTVVVDDLAIDPDAAPTSDAFRSALSIPFGDDGVLQFLATEEAAFSTIDRELGELLVATLTNALGRVRFERAVERERDQFAALFENVPDAALEYRVEDGEQIVEAVNSSFVRVFGHHGEDVVGESVAEILLPPGERDEPERLSVVGGERRTDVEVVRETASGPRPFLLRNVPMRTDDESIKGYLIYADLTALKVRERELERKNERLDQFASIVSHDLRNPLNVAAGYLELAKEECDCEELADIEQAHRRMERLIEDVLSLARDGDVDDPQPVHLGTAVREAWNNVRTDDASLVVDADALVEADATRLLQLLENLFRNAVEHGGEDVTVRVAATPDGFAVEDDGPGIPAADREHVFESGYSSSEENTGLGLAIVRQIVDAHGWAVEIGAGRGGGARFAFDVDSGALSGEPHLIDGFGGREP